MHKTKVVKTISDAKASLFKLVAEAEIGTVVVIGRAGKPVVQLTAYKESTSEPRNLDAGNWQGRVKMGHDFDELPQTFLQHFVKVPPTG